MVAQKSSWRYRIGFSEAVNKKTRVVLLLSFLSLLFVINSFVYAKPEKNEKSIESQVPTARVGSVAKTLKLEDVLIKDERLQTSRSLRNKNEKEIDLPAFKKFIIEANPSYMQPATEPKIVFDESSQQFIVQPGTNGREPNILAAAEQFRSQLKNHDFSEIQISERILFPKKSNEQAIKAAKEANQILYNSFILRTGYQEFTPETHLKASWIEFDNNLNLKINDKRVTEFISESARQASHYGANASVSIDGRIVQQGTDSQAVNNEREVIEASKNQLVNMEPIDQTFQTSIQPPKTIEMQSYSKWIKIDLSQQTLTAFEKDKKVFGPVYIASGMSGHETVTGLFNIWLKNRSQTMRGGNKAAGTDYEIPNVEWVSYFHEEYAIHGAWWRDYFGTPGSHGCVNMTNADAEWIYNWNEIGTPVFVHY